MSGVADAQPWREVGVRRSSGTWRLDRTSDTVSLGKPPRPPVTWGCTQRHTGVYTPSPSRGPPRPTQTIDGPPGTPGSRQGRFDDGNPSGRRPSSFRATRIQR